MEILLETDRLILRRFTEQDADALFDLHNDPEVMHFLNGGRPASREKVRTQTLPTILRAYERHPHFGWWAADERSTGEFVGWFELRPNNDKPPYEAMLGYRLHRSAWGRGLATEGARALIRKAFTELRVIRVIADTMAVNSGSRRVMEKAGLTLVRTFHTPWDGPDPIAGHEQGEVEYALNRDDWQARQNAS